MNKFLVKIMFLGILAAYLFFGGSLYANPLICPNCGGRMKIIAFIKKKTVIESILKPR